MSYPISYQTPPGGNLPVFRVDPLMVLVLSVITCGLYKIYWNLKVAEVLNAVAGRDAISTPIAALSGCCHPVNIYFYYLAGQLMGDLGRHLGKEQVLRDKSTLLLILAIFFAPAAAMIVQGHINELYPDRP